MRKYFQISILLVLVFSSCKKWLDVSPENRLSEDDQFSTAAGFADALYGVYQLAGNATVYGENLSVGFMEVLAQRYTNITSTTSMPLFYQASRYNYTDAATQTRIYDIWVNMYKTIAQINLILKNAESRKGVLDAQTYSLLKGECLGLRAYIHLDLLQLFGTAYANNPQALAIPYLKDFTVVPQAKKTVEEVTLDCEQDLKEAEQLLSVYPDVTLQADYYSTSQVPVPINFLASRQKRFNYWAARAELAKLYIYKGNKPLALQYAKEVIESQRFRFPTNAEADRTGNYEDKTFSTDQVFSLYVSGLNVTADKYFKPLSGNSTISTKLVVANSPTNNNNRLEKLYEVEKGFGTDKRYLRHWKAPAANASAIPKWFSKFWQDDGSVQSIPIQPVFRNLMPLIRLAEMYYIAAEAETDPARAVGYLNTVRTGRFIPTPLPDNLSPEQLETELLKEYQKELFGEGRLFYYYKRKRFAMIPDSPFPATTEAQYTLPLPLNEIEFGK